MDAAGQPIVGDSFLLLVNAHHEPIAFVLPTHQARLRWALVLDTRGWDMEPRAPVFGAGDQYPLDGRSIAVLRLRHPSTQS
jgi:glycogen operon protein